MESGFGIIIVVRFTCRLGFGSSSMWHVLYDHVNVIDGVAGPCRRRWHVQLQGGQGLLTEGLTPLFVEKHRLYKHWKFTMCPFWTWSLWDDKTAIDNVWQLTSCNVRRHMANFYEVPVIRSYRLLTQLYFRCVALRLPAILSTWNSYCWNEFKFLYIEVSVLRTHESLFRSTIELYVEVIRLDVSVPRAPFMEMSVWIFHHQAPYVVVFWLSVLDF